MDDKELFESAISDQPITPAETAPETPETVTDDRPRDEQGRFAAKAPDADAAPTQQQPGATEEPAQQPQDDDAKVPSWRLRELREQREAAEARARDYETRERATAQQLAHLQRQFEQATKKPPEPVDFFTDPDTAVDQRINPLRDQFSQDISDIRLDNSRTRAMVRYGAGAVDEMEAAVDQAMKGNDPDMPSLAASMRNSRDPVGVAMEWHKRTKLIKETGGDINAYREKTLEAALNDPTFLAKALERARTQASGSQNGRPNVQLPPSIGRIASAAPALDDGDSDTSEAALFRRASR